MVGFTDQKGAPPGQDAGCEGTQDEALRVIDHSCHQAVETRVYSSTDQVIHGVKTKVGFMGHANHILAPAGSFKSHLPAIRIKWFVLAASCGG